MIRDGMIVEMLAWDAEQRSRDFVQLSQRASQRATQCRQRVTDSPGQKWHHDAALAEFYVYDHLHDGICLRTPAALAEELRSMKNLDFRNDHGIYDWDHFERRRLRLIDDLIAQFEKGAV